MEPERRYPLLLAFAAQSLEDIIDETLDLFQRCLAEAYHQAKRELEAFRLNVAALTDQIVRHFQATGLLILNSDIADSELRSVLYTYLPTDKFQAAVEDCARLVRPADGTYFDYLLESYKSLHAFVPEFLANFTFEANAKAQPTLDALEVLRKGFAEGRKGISNHSTLTFVPHKWLNYVLEANGAINSRYYELCALSELRAGLRGGNIWVEGSRRYNRPEKYLIPLPKWRDLRPEVCRQTGIGVDAGAHLAQLEAELEEAMTRLEVAVGGGSTSHLRLENDRLVVSPLETELTPPGAVYLGRQCEARLPLVELVELVTEVDRWTKFSETFVHAAGAGSGIRTPEQRTYLFAAILAQACNLGPVNMARSAGLDPERLIRYTLWYLREETLGEAVVRLVNYQFGLPISRQWGNGTLSSSDGQRFPASLPNRQSAKLPKYFGYGKGLTFYTWTADNYAQYGSKPIVSTTREATYILDEILDNETELPLLEHASDTHGYTELIFGLFSLLGLKFSPRIRDVAGQQLYHMGTSQLKAHSALKPLFGGTINRWLIVSQWDELLRLAGSLKMGYVSASLLIAKLQAFPQKNAVAQALIEYGRLVKSLFILRYLESEQAQHRIETQLNKGENLHSLRKYIFYGNHGEVRKRQSEDSLNQVSCLNLVVNCCVVWNTIYMQAVIAQVRAEGIEVEESDLVHLAPARYEHVNPHGRYFFQEALAEEFTMDNLRPLRAAGYGTQVSASNLEEELGWL
jgi:TnpA family transposase